MPEAVKVVWFGPQVKFAMRKKAGLRVEAAARFLRDYIKVKLSRTQAYKIYGKAAGRSRKGLAPSAPGEYPKKLTSNLRKNIQMEMDFSTLSARVGTNVVYGKFLELGTKNMRRRPWLSRGLREAAPAMRRILSGPGGGIA